jgi:hypothetical protein
MKRVHDIVSALLVALAVGGCADPGHLLGLKDSRESPRIRLSCYASSTLGTVFGDATDMGMHGYRDGSKENNGIVYTCRGGHLDIPHVRKAADWTAYLADKAYQRLKAGDRTFSFKLWEPSRYYVRLDYPDDWSILPPTERDRIARDISIQLGQHFAYTALTWHEILTWFGYRPLPWYPEFPSAFSWEDNFSNLLGTHVAGRALRDTRRDYDQAMTRALDQELARLGPQPKEVAMRAAELVRGQWYSGDILFLVDIKKRHLDIGLDDDLVTPWLVPSLDECRGATPRSYPTPSLGLLEVHGFAMRLEIAPKEFERDKMLTIVYPDRKTRRDRLEPARHFAPIMARIRQEARERYGPQVDRPD